MLQEMRRPVGLLGLKAATSVDPDANGGSAGGEGGLRSDAEAIGESRNAGGGGSENRGMISEVGVGRSITEEARVRVIKALDLRLHSGGKMVVDHHRRGDGGRGGVGGCSDCGGCGAIGEEIWWAGSARE